MRSVDLSVKIFQPCAIRFKAALSRIRMLSDVISIILRLPKLASVRVTVSRDEQII